MTFDELRTFICCARVKNFSKAAAILYISQSTVSARIKNIETQLGVELFTRGNSDLSLTPAGYNFLNYALSIDKLIDEAQYTLQNTQKYTCQISISAPDSHWTYAIIPALINYFASTNISYKLFSEHSWIVNQQILENKIDLGITCQYLNHPDIFCDFLYEYPYHLVSHPDLKLPKEPMGLENISSWPLIYLNWGQQFDEWFRRNLYAGAHFLELESISTYIYLLLNKAGCGFLSDRIAKSYIDEGKLVTHNFRHFKSAPMDVAYIIYNKSKEKRVSSIVNEIKAYIETKIKSTYA